jgi:hypothetical protein
MEPVGNDFKFGPKMKSTLTVDANNLLQDKMSWLFGNMSRTWLIVTHNCELLLTT